MFKHVTILLLATAFLFSCAGLQFNTDQEQLAKVAIKITARRLAITVAKHYPDAVSPIERMAQAVVTTDNAEDSISLLELALGAIPEGDSMEDQLLQQDIEEILSLIVVESETAEKYIDTELVQAAAGAMIQGFMLARMDSR